MKDNFVKFMIQFHINIKYFDLVFTHIAFQLLVYELVIRIRVYIVNICPINEFAEYFD